MKSHRSALSCSVASDLRSALGLPAHLSSSCVTVDSIFDPQDYPRSAGAGKGVNAEAKVDGENISEGEGEGEGEDEDEVIYPDTNGNGGQRPMERGVDQAHRRRIQHLNAFLTEGVSKYTSDRSNKHMENVRADTRI